MLELSEVGWLTPYMPQIKQRNMEQNQMAYTCQLQVARRQRLAINVKCFKQEEIKYAGFRVDRKHFKNKAYRKRWRYGNRGISLPEFSSNTNPK